MTVFVGSSDTTGYTDTSANSSYNCVGGANIRVYWRTFSCGTTGNVTDLFFYTQGWSAAQSLKFLIADNSGTVLAASAGVSSASSGWNSVSIASTAVTSGNSYRLGFISNCTGTEYTNFFGNTGITNIDYDNVGNTYANNPPASTIVSDGQASYYGFLMYGSGSTAAPVLMGQACF